MTKSFKLPVTSGSSGPEFSVDPLNSLIRADEPHSVIHSLSSNDQ